jgi:translation elongation factor EF-Tu-like GTPase
MNFLKRLFGRQTNDETPSLYQPESGPSQSESEPPSAGLFRMAVDDIFVISNRGIVLTGQVKYGTLQVGDPIEIRDSRTQVKTKVVSIEAFRKPLQTAKQGDQIGILLPADVPRVVLNKNMVVFKRGV